MPGHNYFNKISAGYFWPSRRYEAEHTLWGTRSELCDRSSNAEGQKIDKKIVKIIMPRYLCVRDSVMIKVPSPLTLNILIQHRLLSPLVEPEALQWV